MIDESLCDCIASGNTKKPKQHGADPHAKNCRVYQTPMTITGRTPSEPAVYMITRTGIMRIPKD